MENIEFTDRYSATGTPYPDETSCDWCEGMGVSPMSKEKANEVAVKEGANHKLIICGQMESDDIPCEEDGYLFILCPECFGTRKKGATNEQKLSQLKEKFGL